MSADHIDRWLAPQDWRRDVDAPCIGLGPHGAFDDMHVFAPCVALLDGQYRMWYSGSRGDVESRVFRLGLAESDDGRVFIRHPASPVLGFADGRRSVLTPAILRSPDGAALREDGMLRLWFAATDFLANDGRHTLHESASRDGVRWSEPSPMELDGIYAPTIVRVDDGARRRYRMWYVDVAAAPWIVRHAESADGREWRVTGEPCIVIDQPWEHERLFYPTVLRAADGTWLMWYGSYSARKPALMTALGIAASADGLHWRKSPHNPVFGPDPARPWESHFTTSQSVLRLDGGFRIWYATRPAPPFVHKYFAIGTARWPNPPAESAP